jgi:YD repeat-containing protein
LVDTEAATVASLCESGEIHSWEVLDARGQVLALTHGRCHRDRDEGAPAPWQVECQLLQDEHARYELSTWLDDDGRPVAAQLRDGYTTRYYHWQEDRIIEHHLGDVRTLRADAGQATTWMLPSHALFLREVMLRLGTGHEPGTLHQTSYAPDRDALSTLTIVPVRENEDGPSASASLNGSSFQFGGADAGLAGLTIDSLRNADGVEVYRSCEAHEFRTQLPETPQPSYRLSSGLELLAIEIPSTGDEPALGAEIVRLTRAKSDSEAGSSHASKSSPSPGVLFISGAGAQDRLGFVPQQGVDVGSHEIHDGLARAGFAVLRYDDRGVGLSGAGSDVTPGFEDSVNDARRAWRALALHPDVDPGKITIIGHGEGALVAMKLAQEKLKKGRRKYGVDRVVLLAAPGRNLRELIYDEIRRSHADRHEVEIEGAVRSARMIHDAALADGDLPASSEPLRDWMREVFTIDPLEELGRVRVPVLALHGDKDFQVSGELDFQVIATLLMEREDGSEARSFPELDHLFKREPTQSSPGHYRDLGRHVDDALVQSIVTWLTSPDQS